MGYYYEGMHYSISEKNPFALSPSTHGEPASNHISFSSFGDKLPSPLFDFLLRKPLNKITSYNYNTMQGLIFGSGQS
jgi:hypothetical protein